MDPLTLLRELFGEEPIHKLVSSGFDSVPKIATAVPESLSFFAGINEVLARQIITSAGESLKVPSGSGNRGAPGEIPETGEGAVPTPVKPRTSARSPARSRGAQAAAGGPARPVLDENPLLDVGGLARTLAAGVRAKEVEVPEEKLLEQVGLTDDETSFLEGVSPWTRPSGRGRTSPPGVRMAPPEPVPARDASDEIDLAPVSDWSPETDPDPVPRIVRATELGPGEDVSNGEARPAVDAGPTAAGIVAATEPSGEQPKPSWNAGREPIERAGPERPSFWRFGR